jgi:hypothetical protein
MNDTTQTLIRAILKVGGGYLVAKGITDDSHVEQAIAAILTLAGIIWGVIHRTPKPVINTTVTKLLILLAPALAAGSVLQGCATPARTAYTTEATVQVSVEAALTAWGAYVHQYHPPAIQELAVVKALSAYKSAMILAIDASMAGTADAATKHQAAAQALSDLVALIRQYGGKI